MKNAPHIASHSAELPLYPKSAPEWIQLLPPGVFSGRDGRGPYRAHDVDAIIAATREYFGHADIPLDYNHQTELAAENGKPAPAAGWIKQLGGDETDGLWGRVEWTEAGAAAVAAREFRYISPVFYHDKEGRVLMLRSAALTNLPNLDLKALSSAQKGADANTHKEHSMDFKKAVAQSLGLSPDAGEAEIIAAAQSQRDALAQAGKALNASEGPAGLVLAAQEAASRAARADNPDPAKFVPMSMHESVSRELAALKAEQAKSRAEDLVKAAQSAGKLTPAMTGWGMSYAAENPEGFKAWMETAPDLRPGGGNASGASAAPPDKGAPALNEAEKAVCAAFGLSEEEFQKAGV